MRKGLESPALGRWWTESRGGPGAGVGWRGTEWPTGPGKTVRVVGRASLLLTAAPGPAPSDPRPPELPQPHPVALSLRPASCPLWRCAECPVSNVPVAACPHLPPSCRIPRPRALPGTLRAFQDAHCTSADCWPRGWRPTQTRGRLWTVTPTPQTVGVRPSLWTQPGEPHDLGRPPQPWAWCAHTVLSPALLLRDTGSMPPSGCLESLGRWHTARLWGLRNGVWTLTSQRPRGWGNGTGRSPGQ